MKRILVLIKGLGRGGAEQLLVSAAPHWDRRRFQYEVAYLLPWKNALVGSLRAAGVPVHCLEARRGARWVQRLRHLVREREVDLVHSHSPLAAVGARVGLGSRVHQVYTEHNVWGRYHRATYWANALTYYRSSHVFAVSDSVRASIRYPRPLRVLPMPAVETLHHGLDLEAAAHWSPSTRIRDQLGIPQEAPVVGTVANFKEHKGLQYLLRSAVLVRAAVPDVRVVLVGRGPLEGELRRMTRELGLDGAVVFAGFREDAPQVAGTFDVFVLPSLHEGLAIALIEAMALGRPAVVTSAGGLPEVLEHGREGFMVSPRDPRALADALVALLRDTALRERFGQAARERAAAFDIRTAVRRMEEVYEELLA